MYLHLNVLSAYIPGKKLTAKVMAFLFVLVTGIGISLSFAQNDKAEQLYNNMRQALIEPGNDFSQVIFIGDNTIYNDRAPGGDVQMDTRKAYNFKENSRRTDFKSPVGQVTLFMEDGKARKVVKGRQSPLRDYEKEQLKNGLNFHYLNIALHGEKFDPDFAGTEEREGITYDKLKFTIEGNEVVYFVNPQTYYPDVVQFRQYSDDAGEVVQVTDHYSDWRKENGIAIAYKKESYEKGEISGSFTYKSVKFE